MNKGIIVFLLVLGFMSCKPSMKESSKLEIAEKYYAYLNSADSKGMAKIIGDSLLTRETEADYQEVFSNEGYRTWLKWDSAFDPTYKVIEIEENNNVVNAKVSKYDTRLSFLHEEPMVWNEVLEFDKNKITKVERVKYEVFDIPRFLKNREALVSWVKENHPELDGFITDQTEEGAAKYLKALKLFQDRQAK